MENKKAATASEVSKSNKFKHEIPVQIRFNDIDTLGHVNNSIYFSFFDFGKAKYFNTVREKEIDWKNADIVVANINCDFFAPVYFNENIGVQTRVSAIYNKSFKMVQRIIDLDTTEIKCICSTIMVGFDIEKGCAAPIDIEWKDALCRYEGRNLVTNEKK